jgi:hypothetical protein
VLLDLEALRVTRRVVDELGEDVADVGVEFSEVIDGRCLRSLTVSRFAGATPGLSKTPTALVSFPEAASCSARLMSAALDSSAVVSYMARGVAASAAASYMADSHRLSHSPRLNAARRPARPPWRLGAASPPRFSVRNRRMGRFEVVKEPAGALAVRLLVGPLRARRKAMHHAVVKSFGTDLSVRQRWLVVRRPPPAAWARAHDFASSKLMLMLSTSGGRPAAVAAACSAAASAAATAAVRAAVRASASALSASASASRLHVCLDKLIIARVSTHDFGSVVGLVVVVARLTALWVGGLARLAGVELAGRVRCAGGGSVGDGAGAGGCASLAARPCRAGGGVGD